MGLFSRSPKEERYTVSLFDVYTRTNFENDILAVLFEAFKMIGAPLIEEPRFVENSVSLEDVVFFKLNEDISGNVDVFESGMIYITIERIETSSISEEMIIKALNHLCAYIYQKIGNFGITPQKEIKGRMVRWNDFFPEKEHKTFM